MGIDTYHLDKLAAMVSNEGESACKHIQALVPCILSWTFQFSLCGVDAANAAGLQQWRPVGDLRAN